MIRVLACLLVFIAAPALAQSANDDAFTALTQREWAWRQALDGSDDAISARLSDVSPAAQASRLAYWQDIEKQLDTIGKGSLTPAHRDDFAVYKAGIDALVAQQVFREYERPLNSDSAFWSDLLYVTDQPFRTEADYRNYLSQLSEMPRYFDQNIANMRTGLARGFTPPRVTLEGRDASIRTIIDAAPEADGFYKPFVTMPASIPAAVQADLRAQAVRVIREAVVPAHRKLLAFLDTDYIPHAQAAIGASALPGGMAYYRSKIREYTTLDLDPETIHQTGLTEVARIHAEMLVTMKDAHFNGDLPAFLQFFRTDPQFYAKTSQELLDRAAWTSKRFDGIADKWFGHLPRRRFGIEPVAPEFAPYYTSGRGGPGVYYVNTYDLKSRPLFQLTALTLHESAPGHAFQIPLAEENMALSPFRRRTYISAYGEGWALYCERLGVEMGLYDSAYDRFGYLSYQMWRAARLVVDTGIHAKGWTRDQARQYLRDNTALSEHEIDTEVDRYISWPGQALSYYLGEMTIVAAREKAEKALGPKFNIRAFHDSVLELGSVPLPVLTAHIDAFIANGGVGPYPDEEK